MSALPDFIDPMLAKLGKRAFDSSEHLFEAKWDGFRALAFVEDGGLRLLSRRQRDFTPRYPELAFLGDLARAPLVLDGEMVAVRDGKPEFEAMLKREQARHDVRIRELMAELPVTYVVFDLLYLGGESTMELPLFDRRELLEMVVGDADDPRLQLSEGVVGAGRAFFEQMATLDFEGMVAKRLDGRYEPGQRSGSWTKIKTTQETVCAILGYALDDTDDIKSLVIAMHDQDKGLCCVGKVGSGLTEAMRVHLKRLLDERATDQPLVDPCGIAGRWAEPGLFCKVAYIGLTSSGTLREPVFLELIDA